MAAQLEYDQGVYCFLTIVPLLQKFDFQIGPDVELVLLGVAGSLSQSVISYYKAWALNGRRLPKTIAGEALLKRNIVYAEGSRAFVAAIVVWLCIILGVFSGPALATIMGFSISTAIEMFTPSAIEQTQED